MDSRPETNRVGRFHSHAAHTFRCGGKLLSLRVSWLPPRWHALYGTLQCEQQVCSGADERVRTWLPATVRKARSDGYQQLLQSLSRFVRSGDHGIAVL